MKTLFITHHYLGGNGGGVFASRAFINAFAELSDEMALLYPMKEGADPEHINPDVRSVPVWDERSKPQKVLDLLTGHSNRFEKVGQFIGDEHFDMVVFDTSLVVHGIIDHFKKQGAQVVTIHHNYQYEYFRDNTSFPIRLPVLFWSRRFESEAVRKSDLSLTLTEADKQLLQHHYGTGHEYFAVTGAFEYERRTIPSFPEINECRFLITGDLSARQTERSLLPWLEDYYPLLKDVFPEATLTLAGKSPSKALVQKAEGKGIDVISSPESMLPVLAEARYYICPTSLGGGLKLRVMDGLSAGLPVLCHQVSARGYEPFIESGLLLPYDNPSSFLVQLEKLKSLRVDKQQLIGRYKQLFSFESGKKRLAQFVTMLKR